MFGGLVIIQLQLYHKEYILDLDYFQENNSYMPGKPGNIMLRQFWASKLALCLIQPVKVS